MNPFARRTDESAFVVLWRAFFAQFFANEIVTSDILLRQKMIHTLAFILPIGLFLLADLFVAFDFMALYAPHQIQGYMIRLAVAFVTLSMALVGLVTVFVWDALAFDRRDAMVLGPLPVRGATIVTAKLAALFSFLMCLSLIVNVTTAVPFGFVTSNRFPVSALFTHMAAHLTATLSGAACVFASIVTIRGAVALVGGARLAVRLGVVLQFVFVVVVLSFLVMVPRLLDFGDTTFSWVSYAGWLPINWFVGLFEVIRGTADAELVRRANLAVVSTVVTLATAMFVSVVGFRRQAQLALTPSASEGPLGAARLGRWIARRMAGRDPRAGAVADFILLTLVRNRRQQAAVAANLAIGFTIVMAAISSESGDAVPFAARTSVLWIPLSIAYWLAVGLRAAAFTPAELTASWAFKAHANDENSWVRRAIPAATTGIIVPPAIAASLLLGLAVDWQVAAWNAVMSAAGALLIAEAVSLTVWHIPFTRAYQPGHAKLRTRWPIYLFGTWVFAYLPASLQARSESHPAAMLALTIGLLALAFGAAVASQRIKRTPQTDAELAGEATTTSLDIGLIQRQANPEVTPP